ncbi:MAG: SCP2 sterol-binding domain-containing protein [Chloroflexi bacterium]|nr:SCP2 sterol-binding domain-containing protein [Chloroflexota bacterium]
MANAEEVRSLFPAMVDRFLPEKAGDMNATILFDLSGDNGGYFWIKIADGAATTGPGELSDPALTVKASADDWFAVATGEMNAMQAFMTGKLKILGDMGLAMKIQTIFAQ